MSKWHIHILKSKYLKRISEDFEEDKGMISLWSGWTLYFKTAKKINISRKLSDYYSLYFKHEPTKVLQKTHLLKPYV